MPQLKVKIDADGRAEVRDESVNFEGTPQAEAALTCWNMPAGQVGAHIEQFRGNLKAGDLSAMRDVANEAAKEKARGA